MSEDMALVEPADLSHASRVRVLTFVSNLPATH